MRKFCFSKFLIAILITSMILGVMRLTAQTHIAPSEAAQLSSILPASGPAVCTVTPEFSISANPSIVQFRLDLTGVSTITLHSLNGFAGSVSLASILVFGMGLGVTFSPASSTLTPGGSSTSTVQFSSLEPGVFSVEANATSSSQTQTTFVFVKVLSTTPGLDISADPVLVNFTAGGTGSSTINMASVNDFAGLASLTSNVFSTVFPAPLAVGFSRDMATVLPAGTNSSTATFSSSTPGFYTVTLSVTADDISSGLIVHNQTYVYVNVMPSTSTPDFSMFAFPSIVSIKLGFSITSKITLQSVNGFQGTIALTSSNPTEVSDVSVSFAPKSMTLTPGSTADSIATFSSFAQGPIAEFVIVNATSGPLRHAVSVEVVIEPATSDFSLSSSAQSLSISQGGSGSSTISVSSINSFSGDVRLSLSSDSSEFAASLSQIVVSLSSGLLVAYTQLSVCTTGNTPLGMYSLGVAGMSGASFHVVTVGVTLTPPSPPDFTISTGPDSITIREGNTGSFTVTVVPSNGFASDVSLAAAVSPSGPATSFSRTSITGGSGTSSLAIHVGNSQAAGRYTVTVVGTSRSLSHQLNITLIVTSPPLASSSSIFGIPPALFYGTIGGIIFGIAAIALVAFRFRKPSTIMVSGNWY